MVKCDNVREKFDVTLLLVLSKAVLCSGKTLLRRSKKLPNSGEALKLMIPNYSWKIISGWISGKVISHKMSESEMGDRGSKSEFVMNSVKEQRVDGNGCYNLKHQRCTLMGFERNYPVNNLSKQLINNNLFFSTVSCNDTKLNPYFVSGFVDAEGHFGTTIYKDSKLKTNWRVLSYFSISLNEKDSILLEQLKEFFGGIGTIRKDIKSNALKYSVSDTKDLTNIIIPHFNKYPLLTQKKADFLLFSEIIELKNKGFKNRWFTPNN